MSSEKRLVLTLVLTIGSVYGIQFAMERMGWIKPPAIEPPAIEAAKDKDQDPAKDKAKLQKDRELAKAGEVKKGDLPDDVFARDQAPPPAPAANPVEPAPKPGPKKVNAAELVLGSDDDESPGAYHLRLQLDQLGAAVARATSARYDAEFDPAAPPNVGRSPRLKLIDDGSPDSGIPGSLSLTVTSTAKANRALKVAPDDAAIDPPRVEAPLDREFWEVVRDREGAPAVKLVTKIDPANGSKIEGQEVAFRTRAVDPPVEVTKVYRIYKGEDGFEVDLKFASPVDDSKFTYKLYGPHGIPIEGEWYTSTFRDVFFASEGGKEPATHASTEIIKYKDDLSSMRVFTLPLKYAGVEDQYFATFVQPWPIPRSPEERKEQEAGPVVFAEDLRAPQKSDVGVEVISRPIVLGPNLGEVVHTYRVFAGPKVDAALTPYEADDLSSYRKNTWYFIPFAASLAKYVIAPLLDKIYGLTESVARVFGGSKGNYGIAIILLTMTVRLIMFPLGRKQAMMAKKMQDLQPHIAEVKEKFKDDKEAMTRETMALWKRHKVNPAAGCVPALIQMPIFVGLWQSLNNSVALRHSSFLWIRDLAAPDMAWKFPMTIPILGDYLNVLPFLVVSLMLVQTKLFAPPPTTPEAEMNQKMMKYMMIVMAFMFYKVPSGLGLYFITSSTWQICERLLLPKVIANHPKPAAEDDLDDKGRGGPGTNGNGAPQGWLGKRLEKLLEEAAKDKTIRNTGRGEVDRSPGGRDRDRGPRPSPRPRPGKRR
jgi:YidC/Oxa1 family membrane protein insertase